MTLKTMAALVAANDNDYHNPADWDEFDPADALALRDDMAYADDEPMDVVSFMSLIEH